MKKKLISTMILFSLMFTGCAGNTGSGSTAGTAGSAAQEETENTEGETAGKEDAVEEDAEEGFGQGKDEEGEDAQDEAGKVRELEEAAVPGTAVQSDGEYLYVYSDGKIMCFPHGEGEGRELYRIDDSRFANYYYHAAKGRVYLLVRDYTSDESTVVYMIDAESGESSELVKLSGESYDGIIADLSAGDHGMLYLNYSTAGEDDERHRVYILKEDGTVDREEKDIPSPYAAEDELPEGVSPYEILGRTDGKIVLQRYETDDNYNVTMVNYELLSLEDGERTTFAKTQANEEDFRYEMPVPSVGGLLFPFSDAGAMETGFAFAPYDGSGITELFRKPTGRSIRDYNMLESSDACGIIGDTLYYVLPDEEHQRQIYAYDLSGEEETMLPDSPFIDEKTAALGMTFVQDKVEHYFHDDPSMQLLTRNTVSYPQLSGDHAGIDHINEAYRKEAEEVLKMEDIAEQESFYLEMLGVSEEEALSMDPEESQSYMYMSTEDYSFAGVEYVSDKVCTIGMNDFMYTGGAHGYGVTAYKTFDLENGNELLLTDVVDMDKEAFFRVLADNMTKAVLAGEIMTYTDYVEMGTPEEEILEACYDMIEERELNDLNYALTDHGIRIEFSAYDIGPYAAGQQAVVIPYEELTLVSLL